MSILIKNIKMPKDEPLLVKINPDGTVSTTWKNGYKKYESVELPPHGDLIDRDVADEYAYDILAIASDRAYGSQWEAAREMQKIYRESPVVVPKEVDE
jgi:hypothetical protein